MTDTLSERMVEAGARAIWTVYTNSQIPPEDLRGITWEQLTAWAEQRPRLQEIVDLCFTEARACLSTLTAAGLVILPAEMTAEQAARSLAGSGLAQRLRVSSPETYAEMVERRRATWREMVRVMGESGDE